MSYPISPIKTAVTEKRTHINFFKIGVTVDCVIFGYAEKELKVLTIKSDLKEFEGLFSLLGDFVETEEDIEAAPYRILKKRTGMDDVHMEQVQAFGHINRHPSGRVITIAYYALVDSKHHKLHLSDNDLHWHPVNKLKKMAFDHKKILDECLHKLKDVIMERPVIFSLQEVYEAILNEKLDRRNFRKKIASKEWLKDTGEMEKNSSHRPGKLYVLKNQLKKQVVL
jgi:8-oxo-dGTP diphosphatase